MGPDGTERWAFEAGPGVNSSPLIGDEGTIYVGCDDNSLYAVNADGRERWRFSAASVPGGVMDSSPAIDDRGTLYVGSWDDTLYAIDVRGDTPQLGDGPWPMFNHDPAHTARVGATLTPW